MLATTTKMLCKNQGGAAVVRHQGRRWIVLKAGNRAAVHGSKLPVPSVIPDEVEIEINRAIKEKHRKRREIEDSVDSHLKNWQVLHLEEVLCSK